MKFNPITKKGWILIFFALMLFAAGIASVISESETTYRFLAFALGSSLTGIFSVGILMKNK